MGTSPLERDAVKVVTTLLVCTLALGAAAPVTDDVQQQNRQKPAVIVIVGAAGAPEYAEQFAQWAGRWEDACSKSGARYITIGLDEVN